MNKLSKEKRDKLILTIVGMVGVIAVLYFLIITDQQADIQDAESRIASVRNKRDSSERLTKQAAAVQADLEAAKKEIALKEAEMPRANQDHIWFLNLMSERRDRYNGRLDIFEIRTPEPVDPGVLPKFPYRAVALAVRMDGTYQDCGTFIADLENSYPYMRIQLVSITPMVQTGPNTGQGSNNQEEGGKLTFNYRVIALIKSSS